MVPSSALAQAAAATTVTVTAVGAVLSLMRWRCDQAVARMALSAHGRRSYLLSWCTITAPASASALLPGVCA